MLMSVEQLVIGLERAQLEIIVHMKHAYGGQHLLVPVADLPSLADDKEAYIAKRFGVSVQAYHEWERLIEEPRCAAQTLKRRQCKNWIRDASIPQTPADYNPHRNYFCETHEDHTGRDLELSK